MIYLFWWLFQDLLQVLVHGWILAPDVFLMALLFALPLKDHEGGLLLWVAFLGGILWDLRWSGLIGLTGGLYVMALMGMKGIWELVPPSAKGFRIVLGLVLGFHFIVGLLRLLFFGGQGEALFVQFAGQQLGGALVALLSYLSYIGGRSSFHE
jgi:rod shape-determining protein MreD